MGGRFAFLPLGECTCDGSGGEAVNLNIPILASKCDGDRWDTYPIRQRAPFPTSRALVSPRSRIKRERGIKLAIPPPSTLAAIKMPPSPPPPPPTVLETLLSFPARPPPPPPPPASSTKTVSPSASILVEGGRRGDRGIRRRHLFRSPPGPG